jgi:drug/metabolite transporter (DMT)-like permease
MSASDIAAPAPRAAAPLLVAAGAILLFTIMDGAIKALPAHLSTMQIVALRFSFGVPPALLMLMLRVRALPSPAAVRANALRGVLVLLTCLLFFFALRRLAFAQALALTFLAPLFMVGMASLLLGERLTARLLGAIGVGLAGVAVILHGDLTAQGAADVIGIAAALGAAACYAASMILLRRQAQRDRPEVIVLIQQAVPAILALPLALADWTSVPPLLWLVFALLGTMGVIGHFALTWAYARAATGALGVMEYTALPWAALIGFTAFGEVPSLSTLLGGGFILTACLVVTKTRK